MFFFLEHYLQTIHFGIPMVSLYIFVFFYRTYKIHEQFPRSTTINLGPFGSKYSSSFHSNAQSLSGLRDNLQQVFHFIWQKNSDIPVNSWQKNSKAKQLMQFSEIEYLPNYLRNILLIFSRTLSFWKTTLPYIFVPTVRREVFGYGFTKYIKFIRVSPEEQKLCRLQFLLKTRRGIFGNDRANRKFIGLTCNKTNQSRLS